jgi:pimeloyl-ACP methyl ester carboxylesterase
MATLRLDGRAVYYTRPVKKDGAPTLLLIHGAGGSHLDWPREIQRLPQANVFNLDLPGHGRSDGPGHSAIEAYADVVQAFIEALNLQDVVLTGHSMGGAIALQVALRDLNQVERLIIINSAAKLPVAPRILAQALEQPELAVGFIVDSSWGEQADKGMAARGRQKMLQTDPRVLRDDFLACNNFDLRQDVQQISIPSMVIVGSEDQLSPARFGRRLAETMGATHYVEIEGAGHFAMLERPLEVAAAIAQFLGVKATHG